MHIDFLRAFAILAVIVIHVFSDNLTNKLNFYIWNYLHVIIVGFVFCSGYVLYAGYGHKLTKFSLILSWYKKRLIRLIVPFYWYLLAHYGLMLIFPKFFSGLGLTLSRDFIFQSITLIGGSNLNWLPLLFLQLAILFPLLVVIFHKFRKLFWTYIGVAILITVGFTIWQFPYNHYREVMWIPWSLFLVIPWYFVLREQKKKSSLVYFFLAMISAVCFVVLFVTWQHIGRSLTLIDNKYPPNLFYISYEAAGSFFLLGISFWSIFQNKCFVRIYQYISKESYGLFFIHYIVLDFVLSLNKMNSGKISVWWQVVCVIGVSIGIAYVLAVIEKLAKNSYNHITLS